MDRRYAYLRPAPRRAEHESGGLSRFAPRDVKKRRPGVSIACNACRRKKVRCDGGRPVCINCLGAPTQCAYRDEPDLSNEPTQSVVEVIRILNGMPAAETIRMLRLLGTETNASIILSALRDDAMVRGDALADYGMSTMSGNMPEPLEFEIQHPIAYPPVPSVDAKDLQKGLRTDQSGPKTEDETTYSEALPEDMTALSPDSAYETAYNLQSRSPSSHPGGQPGRHRQASPPEICDPRLQELSIRYWTNVDIDNDTAARCISLYLQTDHPLLGHFDPESFVSHLVSGQTEYCSSLLVNALLYWACQMYSAIDPETDSLAIRFCTEAERLWAAERENSRDSLTNIAAAEFLCLGYLGQGRDHAILAYVSEASSMGKRMGLFGVEGQDAMAEPNQCAEGVDAAMKARMHASWGIFNWITLMSLFYRQPGLNSVGQLPTIAIPPCDSSSSPVDSAIADSTQSPFSSVYMGETFPYVCRFWGIMSEISEVYSGSGQLPWGSSSSLSFAEYKFRELLAWSDSMPSRFSQGHDNPHHIQILHLWFHAAVLDIFRPHVQGESKGQRHLRTFANRNITPDAVCAASVAQLIRLITNYRLNYHSSAYTILWHTALIYVINAILNGAKQENWYSDILLCIYAYEGLGRSWRVAGGIAKGLLSLIMQKSDIPSRTARRILHDLEREPDQFPGEIRATFMADLNLALSDPDSATVEHLAKRFEDTVLLKDYTTFFNDTEKS